MDKLNASSEGAQNNAQPQQGVKEPHQTALGYPDSPAALKVLIGSESLDSKHQNTLEVESAISKEAISARGYFSTSDRQILNFLGFARNQQLTPALVIPLWNWKGEHKGVAIRPDIARNDTRTGKTIKYEIPKGEIPVLDVSPLTRSQIDDISKPLLVTEGAKKADAAASRGLCAINLNGVWGFQSKGQALPDWDEIALRGRVVYIAYDSDVREKRGVEMAMRRLHVMLQRKGARVKIIHLPEGPNKAKTGLDDYFARGFDGKPGTVEQLFTFSEDLEPLEETARKRREAEKAAKIEALRASGLPIIETNGRQQQDELEDLSRAIQLLNQKKPTLFHGAAGMVLIEHDDKGAPVIRPATREAVQGIAGQAAKWVRTSEREGVLDVAPPRDLCAIYLALQSQWRGILKLEGTATAPFLAPDGTLCASTGYHESARQWLELPAKFELPDTTPTPQNIEAARELILNDILGEVAFADEASRANAIALMILPFVRRLINGPTPLHLVDAPQRGSGKTYAAELCTLPFGEVPLTSEKPNADEWRKTIFSLLISGPSHIFIDNIKGHLNSSALDLAITGDSVQERLMGSGTMATARVRCVWVATANNAQLTEDAATRSVVIRLDPESDKPDTRQFKSDPKAFIRQNRPKVCAAILTLVRAWQEAGRPNYSGPNRIRFPQWAAVMGGILETVGITGFLDNLAEQRETLAGSEGDEWAQFMALWHQTYGQRAVNAKSLFQLLDKCPELAEQIGGAAGVTSHKFAKVLATKRDVYFGGFKIKPSGKIDRTAAYKAIPKDVQEEIQETASLFENEDNEPEDFAKTPTNPPAQSSLVEPVAPKPPRSGYKVRNEFGPLFDRKPDSGDDSNSQRDEIEEGEI